MLSDHRLLHGGDWTAYFCRLEHSSFTTRDVLYILPHKATIERRAHGISKGNDLTPCSNVPRQVHCHKAPVQVYKYGHSNSPSPFFRFCVDCGTALNWNFILN